MLRIIDCLACCRVTLTFQPAGDRGRVLSGAPTFGPRLDRGRVLSRTPALLHYTLLYNYTMPKARKAQRICPHCKKVFSTSYLAEHRRSCTNQKSTCRVCHTEFSRKRDHKCKGTPVELPNYLADFIDVSQYNWGEQVPRSIPGLTPIHEASVATKSLWHRMPRLVHIKAPVPELKVFLAVNKSLKTLSYHAYKNGTAVHGSGLREHSAAQRKAMAETASISIFQAISRGETKSTKPTLYSDSEPLCYVVNVWTEDIALSPPEYINARYILCGDTTDVGINITPEGSLIDLHCDIGRAGLSVVYGQCEKVLLLFPPTKYNLEHFASTAGLPNRLARIGHLLEGGLVVRINRSLAIDLPSGAVSEASHSKPPN